MYNKKMLTKIFTQFFTPYRIKVCKNKSIQIINDSIRAFDDNSKLYERNYGISKSRGFEVAKIYDLIMLKIVLFYLKK
ncbi:hypothetical protein DWV12_14520 [Clostridium botulinum]|nr:hypothetical protein [Clostridium botulinum]MCS6108562.1 hypothetical protein [Clostridium botulinum]